MVRSELILLALLLGVGIQVVFAQTPIPSPSGTTSAPDPSAIPDAPKPVHQEDSLEGKQTRRILGIIPNFRSVSVDTKLPPLSPREKFKLMAEDSFDYSSFIYVGIMAGMSQGLGSYPEFHTGAPAYGRYYWHAFADNLSGNTMTEAVVPVITHEDPRYYTLGHGGIFKRSAYAISRLLITRTDDGGRSPNFSEIVGNGAGMSMGSLYYPSQERTWTKIGQRWISQIAQDGFSNLGKEFWPNLNAKIFHNHY